MIQVEELKKYFYINDNVLKILDGISFTLEKGETGVILGKSGAGKSTLLHLIGLIDRPTSGRILIFDNDIIELKRKKEAEFRNIHVGFIFQSNNLIMELTALENVALPSMILSGKKRTAMERAKELLVSAGMSDRLDHKPFQLSGGEAQRVNICRAIINSPSIVLADEPTGSLDYSTKKEIIELIFSLKKKYNQTLLIVSHDESFFELVDRRFQLENGKISMV